MAVRLTANEFFSAAACSPRRMLSTAFDRLVYRRAILEIDARATRLIAQSDISKYFCAT
jgi:hypothetical protein